MKKALLLALAGLFAAVAPALAYPPPANVNFTSERGVPFGLVLDGRPLTRGLARQVHIDQLAPGAHWADFTVPTAYGRAVRFRSRVWLEPGLETSFVLIARPGRPLDLRQVNAVALYGPGRGYGGGAYNSPVPYGQYSGGNQNDEYDRNLNEPNGGSYYPGPTGNSYHVMAPQDVDAMLQAVKERPFEASKLTMAKEALSQTSIQADDLKRLLRTLDFESSRVELAKFAYSRVADPQNFYRVYGAFDFDASAREVQQAVGANPQR